MLVACVWRPLFALTFQSRQRGTAGTNPCSRSCLFGRQAFLNMRFSANLKASHIPTELVDLRPYLKITLQEVIGNILLPYPRSSKTPGSRPRKVTGYRLTFQNLRRKARLGAEFCSIMTSSVMWQLGITAPTAGRAAT